MGYVQYYFLIKYYYIFYHKGFVHTVYGFARVFWILCFKSHNDPLISTQVIAIYVKKDID